VLGKHEGVMYYTIGQNKNLGLGGQKQKYYVCKKDVKNNYIYVCDEKNKESFLSSCNCVVKNFN
jgi:tRNA-specific 2-thiouridylase